MIIERRHGGFVTIHARREDVEPGHRIEFGVFEIRFVVAGGVIFRRDFGQPPDTFTLAQLGGILQEFVRRRDIRLGA